MIVVRNKRIVAFIAFGSYPLIILICYIFNIDKLFSFDRYNFYAIIIFLVYMTLLLSWAPNSKIILDDYGITIKNEVNFLFFNIFKKSTTVSWSAIDRVHNWDWCMTIGNSFVFAFMEKEQIRLLRMSFFLQKNIKEAIEYAVKKLPNDKFEIEAQVKIVKMGIPIIIGDELRWQLDMML